MSDARPLLLKDDYVTPNRYWGIYRGVVENCSDPHGQGRLQVRVPLVYGLLTEDEKHDHIPTLSLPWATTLASGGGGYYDTGSQLPIQCGSVVAVQFEGGRRKSYSMMICWRHSRPKVDIRVNTADEQRSMCAVRTLVAVLKLRKLERNPPVPRLRAGAKCVCDEEMER